MGRLRGPGRDGGGEDRLAVEAEGEGPAKEEEMKEACGVALLGEGGPEKLLLPMVRKDSHEGLRPGLFSSAGPPSKGEATRRRGLEGVWRLLLEGRRPSPVALEGDRGTGE